MPESTDAEERQNYYDIVEANNERLLQLINEILDLSKIEAGIVEFTITPVRLHPLCKEIHDALKFRCPEGVELVYEASDEEITVEGDKNRIFQVISNLIGNAFKFTTRGSVGYGYRRKGNGIEFHVSDTGIGIETDKLARVFERFVKVNTFAQGTGLGLSICKTIIERLGGTISVCSEVGKGTTFTFTLPLAKDKRETAEEQNSVSETSFNTPGNAETGNNTYGLNEETHEHQATQTTGASLDTRQPTILIAEDTDSNYICQSNIRKVVPPGTRQRRHGSRNHVRGAASGFNSDGYENAQPQRTGRNENHPRAFARDTHHSSYRLCLRT